MEGNNPSKEEGNPSGVPRQLPFIRGAFDTVLPAIWGSCLQMQTMNFQYCGSRVLSTLVRGVGTNSPHEGNAPWKGMWGMSLPQKTPDRQSVGGKA